MNISRIKYLISLYLAWIPFASVNATIVDSDLLITTSSGISGITYEISLINNSIDKSVNLHEFQIQFFDDFETAILSGSVVTPLNWDYSFEAYTPAISHYNPTVAAPYVMRLFATDKELKESEALGFVPQYTAALQDKSAEINIAQSIFDSTTGAENINKLSRDQSIISAYAAEKNSIVILFLDGLITAQERDDRLAISALEKSQKLKESQAIFDNETIPQRIVFDASVAVAAENFDTTVSTFGLSAAQEEYLQKYVDAGAVRDAALASAQNIYNTAVAIPAQEKASADAFANQSKIQTEQDIYTRFLNSEITAQERDNLLAAAEANYQQALLDNQAAFDQATLAEKQILDAAIAAAATAFESSVTLAASGLGGLSPNFLLSGFGFISPLLLPDLSVIAAITYKQNSVSEPATLVLISARTKINKHLKTHTK